MKDKKNKKNDFGENELITPKSQRDESPDKISEKEIKRENKQLATLFVVIGGVLIVFMLTYLFINSLGNFEYMGSDFKIVKEGQLIFYNTAFPYRDKMTGKYLGDYNFYIRNDPRKLGEDVRFDGGLEIMENVALASTESFNCDGDGVIAVQNLANLLNVAGGKVIKDPNATCDEQGRYTYILLQEANVTGVKQVGPSCYEINIDNCEILEATERFLIEIFAKMNEK